MIGIPVEVEIQNFGNKDILIPLNLYEVVYKNY